MKVIHELVAYFERRGRLNKVQMTTLLRQGFLANDAPVTMMGLCDPVGQTYYFRVQGADAGMVWGTDVYTGDSALAAVAVHAGAVALGATGVVKVTTVTPPSQYMGTTRNGVASQSYGRFDAAFRVEKV